MSAKFSARAKAEGQPALAAALLCGAIAFLAALVTGWLDGRTAGPVLARAALSGLAVGSLGFALASLGVRAIREPGRKADSIPNAQAKATPPAAPATGPPGAAPVDRAGPRGPPGGAAGVPAPGPSGERREALKAPVSG